MVSIYQSVYQITFKRPLERSLFKPASYRPESAQAFLYGRGIELGLSSVCLGKITLVTLKNIYWEHFGKKIIGIGIGILHLVYDLNRHRNINWCVIYGILDMKSMSKYHGAHFTNRYHHCFELSISANIKYLCEKCHRLDLNTYVAHMNP